MDTSSVRDIGSADGCLTDLWHLDRDLPKPLLFEQIVYADRLHHGQSWGNEVLASHFLCGNPLGRLNGKVSACMANQAADNFTRRQGPV